MDSCVPRTCAVKSENYSGSLRKLGSRRSGYEQERAEAALSPIGFAALLEVGGRVEVI